MSWVQDNKRLQALAHTQDPSVILTTKDSCLWKTIASIVWVFTLGQLPRDKFLTRYATTLGPVQAYPRGWPTATVERVVIHESRHTKQARWCGWAVPLLGWIPPLAPWVGLVPMALLYLLLLPVGFNWFRYRFELDADAASWRHQLRYGLWTLEQVLDRADDFAQTVASWDYGKPIPVAWARWGFRKKAEKVIHGQEEA